MQLFRVMQVMRVFFENEQRPTDLVVITFDKANPILCWRGCRSPRFRPSSLAIAHARQAPRQRDVSSPQARITGLQFLPARNGGNELVIARLAMPFGTRDTCVFRK